jgi:hypothetical protein
MLLNNFGAADLLYVDNQDHLIDNPQASVNANVFAGGTGAANSPLRLVVEGTDVINGGSYDISVVVASGITLPSGELDPYLLPYLISNNWTQTGMVIAA